MKYLNKLVKEYCHLYFKTTYPFHYSPVRYILEKKKVQQSNILRFPINVTVSFEQASYVYGALDLRNA